MYAFEKGGRPLLASFTLVVLCAMAWSLTQHGIFYASAQQSALVIASILMGVASILTHHMIQALWLCMTSVMILSMHVIF